MNGWGAEKSERRSTDRPRSKGRQCLYLQILQGYGCAFATKNDIIGKFKG
jgi:hypothetical protein